MSLSRDDKDGLTKWASEITRFITNPSNRDKYPAYAISKEKDGDSSITYGYPASKHEWHILVNGPYGSNLAYSEDRFDLTSDGLQLAVCAALLKYLHAFNDSGEAMSLYCSLCNSGVLYCISVSAREAEKIQLLTESYRIDQVLNADEYAYIKQRVEKKYMEDNSFLTFLTDCDLEQSDLGSIILSGIQMRDPQFYPTVRKSYELRSRESDALAIKYLFQVLQVKGVNCTLADFRQLK